MLSSIIRQSLVEPLRSKFDVRSKSCLRPVGFDRRLKSAETVDNGGRALAHQNDRQAQTGGVVDDHQVTISAGRKSWHASSDIGVECCSRFSARHGEERQTDSQIPSPTLTRHNTPHVASP